MRIFHVNEVIPIFLYLSSQFFEEVCHIVLEKLYLIVYVLDRNIPSVSYDIAQNKQSFGERKIFESRK